MATLAKFTTGIYDIESRNHVFNCGNMFADPGIANAYREHLDSRNIKIVYEGTPNEFLNDLFDESSGEEDIPYMRLVSSRAIWVDSRHNYNNGADFGHASAYEKYYWWNVNSGLQEAEFIGDDMAMINVFDGLKQKIDKAKAAGYDFTYNLHLLD